MTFSTLPWIPTSADQIPPFYEPLLLQKLKRAVQRYRDATNQVMSEYAMELGCFP